MKKKYLLLIIILIVVIVSFLWWYFFNPEDKWICENGVWVAQGQPSAQQPSTGCGDELVSLSSDLQIFSPEADDEVSSPLKITGQARGSWFFEATFPIQLTTVHGLVLGNTYAQAQTDWMTEDFVPFEATLEFVPPSDIAIDIDQGELIFEKANPSGLPEHGAEYRLPVRFKFD